MNDVEKTYVLDGVEVRLTSRQAIKKGSVRTARGNVDRVSVLVEVQPSDPEQGSWKKWVKREDLYEIFDNK